MTARMKPSDLKRLLRSPAVIIGELAGIALAGAFGASLPQLHVFQSGWFAALALLTAASLAIVVVEQFRRLRSQWNHSPSAAAFQSAPFRTEFERPATTTKPSQKIWSERRLGLAGSLVFHSGVLLIIFAGALRALFATDAVVDLIEGETLAPTAAAWSAQWPGLFGKPFRLDQPVTLESITGSRYPSGDLRELKAKLSTGEIAVNHQLHVNGGKVYLAQEFGPAALLEWNSTQREAALLAAAAGKF
jgi:cytochrome c biogenesis protein ResB